MAVATTTTKTPTTTTRPTIPPVATVYRAPDGGLHHARCSTRMDFMGGRAGLELDFYCLTCCEHVTVTPYVLSRLAASANLG
ncbi:MAG TPA: hypothetical protein VFL90_20735 [Methylomirabilota bacterium]|nr:hypothetical protein [Methylomirabilota bacterium]